MGKRRGDAQTENSCIIGVEIMLHPQAAATAILWKWNQSYSLPGWTPGQKVQINGKMQLGANKPVGPILFSLSSSLQQLSTL